MNNIYADGVSQDNSSDVLLSLEEMTGSTIETLERVKEEIKTKKVNIDSALLADQEYLAATEAIKEQQKIKKSARARVMINPAVRQLSNDLDSLRAEQKEKKAALSDYLLELNRMTQQLSFNFGSHEYDIVRQAKIAKRR